MLCTESHACAGEEDGGRSEYKVSHIDKLECSEYESCYRSFFDLTGPTCDDDATASDSDCDGLVIDCITDNVFSCREAFFVATHVEQVNCDADDCESAQFTLLNPDPDFLMNCKGTILIHQNITGNVLVFSH